MRTERTDLNDHHMPEAEAKPRVVTGLIPWAVSVLVIAVLTIGLSIFLILNSPFKLRPIAGSVMIHQAEACDRGASNCSQAADFTPVTLPHFGGPRNQTARVTWQYRLRFDNPAQSGSAQLGIQAVYLPKFGESFSLSLNGHLIENMLPAFKNGKRHGKRHWGRPGFYILSPSLLKANDNVLDIQMSGYGQEGTDIYPVYFGAAEPLKTAYDRRYWVTRGAARLGLLLSVMTVLAMTVLWNSRRKDSYYFWLTLGGLSSGIMVSYFAFDTVLISYRFSTLQAAFAMQVFIFCAVKFFQAYLRINIPWFNRLYLVYLAFSLSFLLFGPEKYIAASAVLLSIVGFLGALFGLALLWLHRHMMRTAVFYTIFLSFLGGTICGVHDIHFFSLSAPYSNSSLLQFMPITVVIAIVWLVGSQMVTSLIQFESLTQTLQTQVDEKTTELERSYEELAKTQRRQAIDAERQRIMMDLHDGIGGHLVNTIAYMENNRLDDPVLKTALETALRDLSLMVDSLEDSNSVATLLGMFRSRLEPLLEQHGLVFKWEIGDEPELPKEGPSQNLMLLRIVQEAVTNSVKHSGASIITIRTDAYSVTIEDDGNGFDLPATQQRAHGGSSGGYGLIGMKRRAKEINAAFDIDSNQHGTRVTLTWADTTS